MTPILGQPLNAGWICQGFSLSRECSAASHAGSRGDQRHVATTLADIRTAGDQWPMPSPPSTGMMAPDT